MSGLFKRDTGVVRNPDGTINKELTEKRQKDIEAKANAKKAAKQEKTKAKTAVVRNPDGSINKELSEKRKEDVAGTQKSVVTEAGKPQKDITKEVAKTAKTAAEENAKKVTPLDVITSPVKTLSEAATNVATTPVSEMVTKGKGETEIPSESETKTIDSLPKAPASDIEESKELLQEKYGVTNTGDDDIDQQNAAAAKEQLVYDLGLYQIDKDGNKVPVEYKESTGRTMSRVGTALTMLLHIATGGVFPIIDCKAIFDDMNKDETTKRMTYEAIRDAAAEGEASKQKVAKQAEVAPETAKQAGRTAYYASGKLESDLQSLQNQIALMREGNANQKDLQAYAQQLSLKAPMELESLLESSGMSQEDYQELFRLIGGQTAVDIFLQRLGTGAGLAGAATAVLKLFGK